MPLRISVSQGDVIRSFRKNFTNNKTTAEEFPAVVIIYSVILLLKRPALFVSTAETIFSSVAADVVSACKNTSVETAFVVKENDCYHIRWFTPKSEIDFYGHATLATAFVLSNYYAQDADTLNLYGQIGEFTVRRSVELIRMEFPAYKLEHIEITDTMIEALGTTRLNIKLSL